MDAKILFISNRSEDVDFCAALATKLKTSSLPITRPAALPEAIATHPNALIFIDVDHEKALDPQSETSTYRVLDQLKNIPASRIFALADQTLFELPKLSRIAAIGNYCLRKYDAFSLDWMPKVLTHALQEDSQELQSFKDATAKEVKIKLTHSNEKAKALAGVEKLLSAKALNERCLQMILQAVDELIMNAIFDAPLDEKGRPYRKSEARDADLHLFNREEIEIGIVLNEKTILIHVKDQFGSFSSEKALAVIQKDYTEIKYKTDAFTQSAGLGLHGVIASGLGLMINVVPNVSTQAVIAFPLFENFKSMRNSFRSFSLSVKD